jgi:MFS family permease
MAITAPFISWYFFSLSGGDFLGSGLVITIPYIFLIFSTAIFGRLSDKIGSKTVVLISLAIYSVSFLSYYFIGDNPELFFIAYVGFNIIISAFIPAFNRLISFEENNRAERMVASIGFLVGSFVVTLLIDRINFLTLFLMASGVSSFTFLLAFKLREPTSSSNLFDQKQTQLTDPNNYFREKWDKQPVIMILILFFISELTNSFSFSFFAIFIEFEVNQAVSWVGVINTVATFLGIGGTYLVGNITQKINNRKPLVVLALILYPLLPLGVLLLINPIFVFIVYCIPVYSIFFVLLPVILSENSPDSERGRLMGYYSASQNVALSIGTFFGAIFVTINGVIRPNFLVAVFFGLLGLIIGVFFYEDPSLERNQV